MKTNITYKNFVARGKKPSDGKTTLTSRKCFALLTKHDVWYDFIFDNMDDFDYTVDFDDDDFDIDDENDFYWDDYYERNS